MSLCTCGHADSRHEKVTYPAMRWPCGMCTRCGIHGSHGKVCCSVPSPCLCVSFVAARVGAA